MNLPNNPLDVGPEPSGVAGAESLAGDADGGTREASRDNIHASTPGSPVEGDKVGVDGGRVEAPIRHSGNQYLPTELVALDIAGGLILITEGEVETQLDPRYSRTKTEALHRASTVGHTVI